MRCDIVLNPPKAGKPFFLTLCAFRKDVARNADYQLYGHKIRPSLTQAVAAAMLVICLLVGGDRPHGKVAGFGVIE